MRPENKTPEILKAYTDPFPTPESRMGTWVFPRAIRKETAWLSQTESRLGLLARKPAELVWALKDPAFGSPKVLERWKRQFPEAGVQTLQDASHYLQEDRPDAIAEAVRRVAARG